jgi:catechol 2,3-dioxygenase-like lactoylglutathione lyase family enzyme
MSVRRVIVDHVLFVVADLDASRRLYTAALAPLGYEETSRSGRLCLLRAEDLDDFTICQGEPVTTAAHVAFSAEGREEVDAFFEAAVANGAAIPGRARRVDAVLRAVLRRIRERLASEQRRGLMEGARPGDRRASPSRRPLILTV